MMCCESLRNTRTNRSLRLLSVAHSAAAKSDGEKFPLIFSSDFFQGDVIKPSVEYLFRVEYFHRH